MNILLRFILLCFVSLCLVACESASTTATPQTARHYRGVVLDADSKTPVSAAIVDACRGRGTLDPAAKAIRLASTQSRKDGSFDLVVPATQGRAAWLEAAVQVPRPRHRPRKGELCLYGGTLDSASDHLQNIVYIRRSYYQ